MDRFGLYVGTLEKILNVLQKYSEIQRAIIYGSRVKGNYKPGSDIDIALDAPTMSFSTQFKLENELDDLLLPYKIDLSTIHNIDNPALLDHIQRVGVVVYPFN